nr:IQ domain-containing protein K isoform X1 [Anas platyrhynchos]XP_038042709.1 IQ domain-containing protein K isoform X1 [Anas platyrhynchos]XP_038042710.1 IQ domain-containing protein K isoform X1 [Anas platyrhynchos]
MTFHLHVLNFSSLHLPLTTTGLFQTTAAITSYLFLPAAPWPCYPFPFSGHSHVRTEYEAEQPLCPDIPESKRQSVSLEAGMLQPLCMEQFYSAPAADTVVQQLLPGPEAAPLPEPPDPKTCSPREYLEYYIFPVLLPGLAELLHQAKKEKCFERKRTKFIACDFLTEWLYNHNPKRKDESFTEFFSIPFVNNWLKIHPRRPMPLSLHLSEEEACIIIQSFWRGYRVRCDKEVQELRQWQKQFREEEHISERVEEFWTEQEDKAFIQGGNL